jgi:twitching motility protein PilT
MDLDKTPHLATMAAMHSDWHIDLNDPRNAVVFPGPERLKPGLYDFADQLVDAITKEENRFLSHSFVVECLGIRFRAQHKQQGKFALRTLKDNIWPLARLQFRQAYNDMLMNGDLKRQGGLVLISGSTGSGKSTTAATVIAARLRKFGGFCLTLEDPPEEPLQGWHDGGYCEQVQIVNGDYRDALVRGLRCFPSKDRSMLLLGEVRNTVAASELLRIGVDGHLVFSTIHANGITEALQRLLNLAREDVGEYEARMLLANSLRLCVHQRLDNNIPQVTMLPVTPQIASIIKDGTTMNLTDEIDAVRRRTSSLPTNANFGSNR